MSQRYAIIGCGAVGGYYGACLQRVGVDVHFLLHRDFDHVRTHGLRVDSKYGNFTLPCVQAYGRAEDLPRCDVALVALKSTANTLLASILPHALRPGGTVLLLQNGLGEDEMIARIPGVGAVVGGLCFLCSNKVGPGHIHHLDYGYITVGEYRAGGAAAGITDTMRAIAADFAPTGVPVQLDEDLLVGRWKKLVWNVPFNGLSVLFNADTRRLIEAVELRPRIRGLMLEIVAAAAATGHAAPGDFVELMITHTESMVPYWPSMKLDYDSGRPMEISTIYEEPLRQGMAAGVAMPLVKTLAAELRAIEAARVQAGT